MDRIRSKRFVHTIALVAVMAAGLVAAPASYAADVTSPFAGKAVNGGTVTHQMVDGRHVLTLSADFKVPGSPDPHWQIVDSKGKAYLLDRVALKDDKVNRTITVPSHIPDIAKVQMWCAWAEVVLGEAAFPSPVMAHTK